MDNGQWGGFIKGNAITDNKKSPSTFLQRGFFSIVNYQLSIGNYLLLSITIRCVDTKLSL
jgi:hypothetical protein